MTPIANITLAQSSSDVTFSNIPNIYKDLVVTVTSTSTTGSEGYSFMRFNNDAGSNYSRVEMVGNGSSTSSAVFSNLIPITYRGVIACQIIQIMDYSSTDKHKTVLYRNNQPDNILLAGSGRWASTSSINVVSLVSFSLAFAAGSTISIYGRIA